MKKLIERVAGFTLIELMLAISLGWIISNSLIQIYLSMKDSYLLQRALLQISEKGLLTTQLLRQEIRGAVSLHGMRGQDGNDLLVVNKIKDHSLTFFIAPSQGLYARQSGKNSEEWIDGVEHMSVHYRLTNGQYFSADEIQNWSQVVAAEIILLLTSSNGLLRQEWKVYASLRNT